MKKTYLKPETREFVFNVESVILAGSDSIGAGGSTDPEDIET